MSVNTTARVFIALLCASLVNAPSSFAAKWLPYGPEGGSARSFAADPKNHAHLYLGTAQGWIYESTDSGGHWKRLAQVGKRDDLVLDSILVDPLNSRHVLVGAFFLDRPEGGLFQSLDGGATWTGVEQMKGESIRSLTGAPSDPKILVAGTLNGIFRSSDSGNHWMRISSVDNPELHNVESLAIDPLDPETIYAGTWHLPWKTTDGGKTWMTIKQGVIDDSDVFSIIVDPHDPRIVFASACSGIYKSEDKGDSFRKVQGIPASARRTRVLMQDPQHLNIVFAGTTEGLFRSDDAGKNWARTTGPEVIVNDVFVDPTDSHRVLLATDRGGVMASNDGANTFSQANTGFSSRQITAFLNDASHTGTMYAGVANDKEWGGVFVSEDGGLAWRQQSAGLGGRDVFSLGQAADGSLIAGTGRGIFRYEDGHWTHTSMHATAVEPALVAAPAPRAGSSKSRQKGGRKPAAATAKTQAGSASSARKTAGTVKRPLKSVPAPKNTPDPTAGPEFDGAVHTLARLGDKLFAGTSRGMLVSSDSGKTWDAVPALKDDEWWYAAAAQNSMVVGSLHGLMLTNDAGATWSPASLPSKVTQLQALTLDERGEIWVGGGEGVYLSSNHGESWQTLQNLYVRDVNSLYFDAKSGQILVTANAPATIVFAMRVTDRKVSFWDAGWTLRLLRPVGDHMLGATLFDGIVIQPRMVDSGEVAPQ